MRVCSTLVLGLASAACIASVAITEPVATDERPVIVEPDAAPAAKPEHVAGEVVVLDNTWLYARPDSDIRFRIHAGDSSGRARRFRVGRPDVLLEVESAYFRAVVRTAASNVLPISSLVGGGGYGYLGSGSTTWYEVAADTIVYWADGNTAGRRRETAEFGRRSSSTPAPDSPESGPRAAT